MANQQQRVEPETAYSAVVVNDHMYPRPLLYMILCRLDSECTVKMADAALAQQFYPECYYTSFLKCFYGPFGSKTI